jgi:predicted transcriptional regulator
MEVHRVILMKILKEKKMSRLGLAFKANISPSDLYQCISGKRAFFPAWRKRISDALDLPEDEVFPEFKKEE